MPTLSESRFPPPKSWEGLEILVWRLFQEIWNDPNALRHGRSGQRQQGVDIYGRPGPGESWEGVQVKGKNGFFGQRVTEQELRGEVQKAKEFLPPIKNFILVTSGQRDVGIQEIARQITQEHLAEGLFNVHVWGWEDVEERLPQFPAIIQEIYPQFQISRQEETYAAGRSLSVVSQKMERIEKLFRELVQLQGPGSIGLETRTLPPLDYPPLDPSIYAPRVELGQNIQGGLQDGTWVALVGPTGTGKTMLAKYIWGIQPSYPKHWISFLGQEGRYEEHLDRQLIRLLTDATQDESLFELYRSGQLPGPDITQHLGSIVNQEALLVLDNVPDLTQNHRFLERLAALAVTWWNSGGRILSTSQYHSAARLTNILGAGLSDFGVPAMDERELGRFLDSAGAPLSLRNSKSANLILGITKGHPVLIAAAIQWLLRNDWDLGQAFVSLTSGEATTQVTEEARSQVRRLVNSDQARDLLDRLSALPHFW